MPDSTNAYKASSELFNLIDGLPGGAGIFYAYPDGRLEEIYLNEGYHSMLEDSRENRRKFAGMSAAMAVHPDDREKMAREIRDAISENRMAEADLRIETGSGGYKWIKVRANIAERTDERVKLYVFYSDIDQLKRTKLRLEASRKAADIASRRGKIVLWLLDIDKRVINRDFQTSMPLDHLGVLENVPEVFCQAGVVHEEDVAAFLEMYQKLFDGAEDCDCTVRIRNNDTGRFEWQHITYTRLHDESYTNRMAIGFSVNVDLQQENLRRYEQELLIRQELMRGAVTYYQINLSTGIIEEFRSTDGELKTNLPKEYHEEISEGILAAVVPEDRDAVRDTLFAVSLAKAYREGKTSASLVYRRHITGEGIRWMRGTATVMKRPESGELTAIIFSRIIDTEMKNQLAVESVIENDANSIAVLNVKSGLARPCRIERGVPSDLKGEKFDELMEKIISKKMLPEDREMCREYFRTSYLTQALQTESTALLTYRTVEDDGKIHHKSVTSYYLDDTREDIVIVRRDITNIFEEGQRQRQALQAAVDAANEANRAKSEFLSHISHDMRTPLNAILSLSDPVLTEGADDAQKDEYLKEIHSSGEYLRGLISDVLDMSRIENKKVVLNPEPYSLSEFSGMINAVIGGQCREKGIEFVFSAEAATNEWVLLDKVRFNQIFINLLSNAVKFTPPGGRVEFKLEHLSEGDGRIMERFTVSDTGIGMSSEFLPRAFDSFAQENRGLTAGEYSGTGLGLSIVKQTVELMGGKIYAESQLGEGTTFTVELEVVAVEAPDREGHYGGEKGILEGRRILLCEDHPLNAKITAQLLENQGCAVEIAENGQVGLDMFRNSRKGYYDAILMDIRMPVMDGLAAARAIRATPRDDAATIPILALTADAFHEDTRVSLAAGMNGHLSKPVVPEQLIDAIYGQIKNRPK